MQFAPPNLYAGGDADFGGDFTVGVWDGEAWSGLGATFDGVVLALTEFDGGGGPTLYAGGGFVDAGGVPAEYIARWTGAQWAPLGSGLLPGPNGCISDGCAGVGAEPYAIVNALAVHDDGSGESLFVGGCFEGAGGKVAHNVARWDGEAWHALGDGLPDGPVHALHVFEGELYAGGEFFDDETWMMWGVSRWDGSQWSRVGDLQDTTTLEVLSFATYDDGTGSALYAGGYFARLGQQDDQGLGVARWDGADWNDLGTGACLAESDCLVCGVDDLAVFDEGAGPRLYAGGSFFEMGGAFSSNVASWDGLAWLPLDGGVTGAVAALEVYESECDGDLLAVGGDLSTVGSEQEETCAVADWGCRAHQAAAEVTRVGSPPNPAALLAGQTSGPVAGASWDPVVDHGSFVPGSVADFLFVSADPLELPLGAPGTLLCELPFLATVFAAGPGIPFEVGIPDSCKLVGLSLCAQAGSSADGVAFFLTNALDITIGTH